MDWPSYMYTVCLCELCYYRTIPIIIRTPPPTPHAPNSEMRTLNVLCHMHCEGVFCPQRLSLVAKLSDQCMHNICVATISCSVYV